MSDGLRERLWWQRGVVYQVYPRSFADANGDGVGDLAGITSKLGYLRRLGVDAVWLSPFYPSPMADFGYDVSDYTGVHPTFGTLRDFDDLVAEAHRLGLKVIPDYVPNHTSDEHPWFLQSRSSKEDPKRDWYIWRDAKPDGSPPNNWLSVFGGPAWTWDAKTEQYYYHAYHEKQPDLNWRNEEVVRAMLDVLRFWLGRGVDGFRVDALRQLVKDKDLRDNPPNPVAYLPEQNAYDSLLPVYSSDRPEVRLMTARMQKVLEEYSSPGQERVLIGELYLPLEKLVAYYGAGVHLPFNFHLIFTPWTPKAVAALVDEYETLLPPGAWPNWVLGNHDRSRVASRIGREQTRVAAMLLLTLRGTPTIYYAEEIGLKDVPIPPERVRDPFEKSVPGHGRDPERTPMQWNARRNAGFSTAEPWLLVSPTYPQVNVEVQRADPRSMLALYRRLLALRRAEPALSVGSYEKVRATNSLFAYTREAGGRRFLVALNFGAKPETLKVPSGGEVVLSTALDREGETFGQKVRLRPDEGVVASL